MSRSHRLVKLDNQQWGQSWLVSPPLFHTPPTSMKKKTPVLTRLMIRLEESLEAYCDQLALPTLKRAIAGTQLLETSAASASSSPSAHHSPLSVSSSPMSGMSGVDVSSWETYTSPFIMLAAAETLYARSIDTKLIPLYAKIGELLGIVKQTLCDPFIESDDVHGRAATSLSQSLDLLIQIVDIRCQLIQLRTALLSPHDLSELLAAVPTIHTVSETTAKSMEVAIQEELELWSVMLETCIYVERCQFQESVIAMSKFKTKLASMESNETTLMKWFGSIFLDVKSILPIYFDRVRAFCKPLYGFEPQKGSVQTDYDTLVLDFLRKQDELMAVCIVHDASDNEQIERGFSAGTESNENKEEWPAVYLRSSSGAMVRSPSSSNSISSRLLGRGPNRRGSGSEKHESSSMKRSSTSSTRGDPTRPPEYQNNVWPHTEWPELVGILRNELNPDELGPAMTFRAEEKVETTDEEVNPGGIFHGKKRDASVAPTSFFHVVSLSSCLWMVAIVNGEDVESKWNLRMTRGYTEEEIRSFLDELAVCLRIPNLFATRPVDETKQKDSKKDGKKETDADLSITALVEDWSDNNIKEWLRKTKDTFGLRHSPMMEPLKSPYMINIQGAARRKSRRRQLSRKPKDDVESAALFFLGSEGLKLAKQGKHKRTQFF